jgi:hypothetical protein
MPLRVVARCCSFHPETTILVTEMIGNLLVTFGEIVVLSSTVSNNSIETAKIEYKKRTLLILT